jgi:5'-3' exonuclease
MLDPKSELRDYYPETFKTDLNGKKQEWKAVVLLSHIDPKRLQNTLGRIWVQRELWTEEERQRNRPGTARILVCNQGETKTLFQRLMALQGDPRRADQVSLHYML